MCQDYKSEIKKVNERANILAKFEKSSKSLKDLLNSQKAFGDKTGLGFNSCEETSQDKLNLWNLLDKSKNSCLEN